MHTHYTSGVASMTYLKAVEAGCEIIDLSLIHILIYPGTQKSSNAFYYMFNAETESGFEQTKAIASFLADHYSGSNSSYGKVSNWIIGNEINNQQWNYMGCLLYTSRCV